MQPRFSFTLILPLLLRIMRDARNLEIVKSSSFLLTCASFFERDGKAGGGKIDTSAFRYRKRALCLRNNNKSN